MEGEEEERGESSSYIYNARKAFLLYAALADYEDYLVFQSVGEIYAAQLQGANPSRNFFGAESGEDVLEFLDFGIAVAVALASSEAVEFFIVVVLYLLTHGSEEAILFAHLMLAATASFCSFDDLRHLVDFSCAKLFTKPPLPHKASNGGYDAETEYEEDEWSHFLGGGKRSFFCDASQNRGKRRLFSATRRGTKNREERRRRAAGRDR